MKSMKPMNIEYKKPEDVQESITDSSRPLNMFRVESNPSSLIQQYSFSLLDFKNRVEDAYKSVLENVRNTLHFV